MRETIVVQTKKDACYLTEDVNFDLNGIVFTTFSGNLIALTFDEVKNMQTRSFKWPETD